MCLCMAFAFSASIWGVKICDMCVLDHCRSLIGGSFYKWMACAACHFNHNKKCTKKVTKLLHMIWILDLRHWFFFFVLPPSIFVSLNRFENLFIVFFVWACFLMVWHTNMLFIVYIRSVVYENMYRTHMNASSIIKWLFRAISKVRTYYFIHIHTIEILYWYCMSS